MVMALLWNSSGSNPVRVRLSYLPPAMKPEPCYKCKQEPQVVHGLGGYRVLCGNKNCEVSGMGTVTDSIKEHAIQQWNDLQKSFEKD
jgi:hypothetical protein